MTRRQKRHLHALSIAWQVLDAAAGDAGLNLTEELATDADERAISKDLNNMALVMYTRYAKYAHKIGASV